MRPSHLHLHVRDVDRSRIFYGRCFGLKERTRHGEIVFLSGNEGFDLALAPDPEPAPMPPWFHFGFRLETADEVRRLCSRMEGARLPLAKPLSDEPDHVTFTCLDPDGYRIEVYWEP